MLAGLWRAIAMTCVAEISAAGSPAPPRVEAVRGARWQAARSGLAGQLVDPTTGESVEAAEAVASLLSAVRPALEETGDMADVESRVAVVLADGGPAARQRAAYSRREQMSDVVDLLLAETARS
jgi:carboxylate-amine ligase